MNYFENVPKEIASKIIKSAGLATLATASQVCSLWAQLIDSSEYWRDYLLRFGNNCCVMQPSPNASAYLFPTKRHGDIQRPDYKRYYFVRKNIEELIVGLNDLGDDIYFIEQKLPLDSELTQENVDQINSVLDNIQFTTEIAKKAFWLRSDAYKIYFERDDPQYKYLTFPKVYETSNIFTDDAKISYSATYLHLAQFCEKHLDISANFFKKACSAFLLVEEPNENYGKLFRSLILQQIAFGRLTSEEVGKRFKFNIPNESFVHEIINEATPHADTLHEILCVIVQEKFENSNDWRIQASALTTLLQTTSHDNERVKATAIWLGLEAIKSSNVAVKLHGYVALHSVLVMFENDNLTKDETLQLFDALSTAIETQPRNFGIFLLEAILCLITEANNELINDEKLNKLNNSVIEMLLDEISIDEHNKVVLITLCKLGTAFGTRIRSLLPRYKHVLLGVIMKRQVVPAAELLDIYFRLGHGTMGEEFNDEASLLFAEVQKGAENFSEIDLPLFCALSGDILPKALNWEFKKNSTKILQHMINFFPEEFELLGQSCLADMSDSIPKGNWPKLPETAEHSKRYFQEVLKRMQNGESLSNDDADEILAQTAETSISSDNEDMASEFICAPDAFASDALLANSGENLLKQKLQMVHYKRGIINLMKTALFMKQDAFPLIQRVFHIALAGFRLTFQDERFIHLFAELVQLIATILTKQHLAYYSHIITNDMVHYARNCISLSGGVTEALYDLFAVLFSIAVSNPLTTSKIVRHLLEFTSTIDRMILNSKIDEFEHGSFLEYFSVLVAKLPNKTQQALTSSIVLYGNDNETNKEAAMELTARTCAIIGLSFGVKFALNFMGGIDDAGATPLDGFRSACLKIIPKYSPDLSYGIMKSFVVLLSCCMIDPRIEDFIEMRRVFDYTIIHDAINHEEFDTGDEILNAEVNKFSSNPFVLFAALKRK